MKKISIIILTSFLLVSCGAYKQLNFEVLTTGMTIAEVQNLMGPPERVFAVDKKEGYIHEVLEYRTGRNELYVLEFRDDCLTGCEYLYDNINFISPVASPMIFTDYKRYPSGHNSNRPIRPSNPESNRAQTKSTPGRSSRPSNSGKSKRTKQYIDQTNINDRSNSGLRR